MLRVAMRVGEGRGDPTADGPAGRNDDTVPSLADSPGTQSYGYTGALGPAYRFDDLFLRLYPGLFDLTYRLLGDRLETEGTLQEAFLTLADSSLLSRPDDAVLHRLVTRREG